MQWMPTFVGGERRLRRTPATSEVESSEALRSVSPLDRSQSSELFPVSHWDELEQMAAAAEQAFLVLSKTDVEDRARFLVNYADRLEAKLTSLAELAHRETALPIEPRLAKFELPRTINQLRSAATSIRKRTWALPTIDTANDIRSILAAIGPVLAMGPNNFPFACNSVCGGDFAAAIAVGCPIIAKANPGHLALSAALAEECFLALQESALPKASFQFFYHCNPEDGLRLVRDARIAAVAFTGSKQAGAILKRAADETGKPIFLEMGSVNPVVVLPGCLHTEFERAVGDFTTSCLQGVGQFCTNPGLVFVVSDHSADDPARKFIDRVADHFRQAPNGPLLSARVRDNLQEAVGHLHQLGAKLHTGGKIADGPGFHFQNSWLETSGQAFLERPIDWQREAFGNSALVVVMDSMEQLEAALEACAGSLTGCVYSARDGSDDEAYERIEPILRRKVGRLLNDKMPTGVTVSPGMNHGGPFPAAWPPNCTAIGIPASLRRFTALQCYDGVRAHRLPAELRNKNLTPPIERFIDGVWVIQDVD